MDKGLYRFLFVTAAVLTVAWIAWTVYDTVFSDLEPGDNAFLAAERMFEDGQYERAVAEYDRALAEYRQARDASPPGNRSAQPAEHLHALRGKARTLMQLGRNQQALDTYDLAIELAPEFAATYANRGILHDRLGHYRRAMEDYKRALNLDPAIAEGPGWMTRFLRLQPQAPPTIVDRLLYLDKELAKPEDERLLRVPEIDAEQRPYKM